MVEKTFRKVWKKGNLTEDNPAWKSLKRSQYNSPFWSERKE